MEISNLDQHASHFDTVVRWVFNEWNPIPPFETPANTRAAMGQRTDQQRLPLAYVAVSDRGEALGTVSLVECDYSPRHDLTPWVADMYVASEHRKRGIGSALMVHLEERAKIAGIATLYLITRQQQHFYAQLGWEVLEPIHYQDVPAVLMYRCLFSQGPGQV